MGFDSFIYDLYNNSNLPWVYGGEYSEFTNLVKTVIQAWIKVGLQVYFVFDGMWIVKPYSAFSTSPGYRRMPRSEVPNYHIAPRPVSYPTSSPFLSHIYRLKVYKQVPK